jgi:asparagine synthase (glutamine-hydrolysing)
MERSDTEVILAAYGKWGIDCVSRFRGMFSFALWDERTKRLFCARDRFGIKPFYFAQIDDTLYFASEAKAILPFMREIETDSTSLKDYLFFQLCLDGRTLFKDVHELPAAHTIVVENGKLKLARYWEVHYTLDFDHTSKYFEEKLKFLIEDSVKVHLRSDVPVGAYVSGGVDSGIIAGIASRHESKGGTFCAFNGKFSLGELYDESAYATSIADRHGMQLWQLDMTSQDFVENIQKVIYHLDYPVAGPGSFPQYQVSKLAKEHRKVVLGGQGGDEIFGGYTRYLIAYFEQCIKGAIDGTLNNGNYVVTYESIIPNLKALKNYKPLLKEFWKEGLFEDLDQRYFRLINRAPDLKQEINWTELGDYSPFQSFQRVFNGANVGKESYFDKMSHFDFKTLLPALLQVEDRMSMAHGLESRVPFLDHPIVEFAATIPADVKFKDGTLKKILVNSMRDELPDAVINRKDKMGFPVPINEWLNGELREFIFDLFSSDKARGRQYLNSTEIIKALKQESKFGRRIWGLLSLELWYQEFHDHRKTYPELRKELKAQPIKV